MNERTLILAVVAVLAAALVFAVGGTDAIYVGCAGAFFALCLAYAAWCERL